MTGTTSNATNNDTTTIGTLAFLESIAGDDSFMVCQAVECQEVVHYDGGSSTAIHQAPAHINVQKSDGDIPRQPANHWLGRRSAPHTVR
jgi:hypothetical protein